MVTGIQVTTQPNYCQVSLSYFLHSPHSVPVAQSRPPVLWMAGSSGRSSAKQGSSSASSPSSGRDTSVSSSGSSPTKLHDPPFIFPVIPLCFQQGGWGCLGSTHEGWAEVPPHQSLKEATPPYYTTLFLSHLYKKALTSSSSFLLL